MGKKETLDETAKAHRKEMRMRKMIYECLVEHPEYVRIVKSKYVDDDLIESVMRVEPELFQYLKNPSLRVINAGLDIDGGNLRYLSEEKLANLPATSYEIALESNPREAIKYVPEGILDERSKLAIFSEDPDVIRDNGIRIDEGLLTPQIIENPSLIKFVVGPSEHLICTAIRWDINVALYYQTLTEKMMDVIDKYWPEYRGKLPNYTRSIEEVPANATEQISEITEKA
jgi:hypothetical protein